MKVTEFIKAAIRARRCKEHILFARKRGGLIGDIFTYKKTKLWSNCELLKLERMGYKIYENTP